MKSLNPLTRQLLADKLATLHQLALADGQIVKTGALLIVLATNQVITKMDRWRQAFLVVVFQQKGFIG